MSVYCTLFSQTFYGLLFCYLTITDVHVLLYLQIIDFQFPSCCTSQAPKKLDQIITVNSSTNTPRSYHQKNNSCTLCVPMFLTSEAHFSALEFGFQVGSHSVFIVRTRNGLFVSSWERAWTLLILQAFRHDHSWNEPFRKRSSSL